jgi:hypothetical protein
MVSAYNGAGHDERPERGHGIGADGLEHAHVVFRILGLDGTSLVDLALLLIVEGGGMVGVGDAVVDMDLRLGLNSGTHGDWWVFSACSM